MSWKTNFDHIQVLQKAFCRKNTEASSVLVYWFMISLLSLESSKIPRSIIIFGWLLNYFSFSYSFKVKDIF